MNAEFETKARALIAEWRKSANSVGSYGFDTEESPAAQSASKYRLVSCAYQLEELLQSIAQGKKP